MTLTERDMDKVKKNAEAVHKHLRKEFEDFKIDTKNDCKEIKKRINQLEKENSNTEIYFSTFNRTIEELKTSLKEQFTELKEAMSSQNRACQYHSKDLDDKFRLEEEKTKAIISKFVEKDEFTEWKNIVKKLNKKYLILTGALAVIFYLLNLFKDKLTNIF